MSTTPDMTVQMTRSFSWLRLFIQSVIVLLVFVAANVYTYTASGFFQREREYTEQVSAVADSPSVRVIFAGDSHFAVPLNDYLNGRPGAPAYSLAYGGDSLRECFAKVRHVLEANPRIDTLILTGDPHMFGQGRAESSNRSFADRYFIADWDRSGVQHNLWSAMLQQVPLFSEDFLQYFRKDLGVLFSRAKPHARAADDPLAWSRLSDEERSRRALDTGRSDHEGMGEVQQSFVWYRRIMDLARSRHVRVIAVRFPVNAGYSGQAPAAKVAELDEFLRDQGVAQILDLRDALTDPKYFEDEDHVNEHGAVLMVKLLEEKLGRALR